jgi:hypothetical protein
MCLKLLNFFNGCANTCIYIYIYIYIYSRGLQPMGRGPLAVKASLTPSMNKGPVLFLFNNMIYLYWLRVICLKKLKLKSRYDWWSVSRYVLVSSPLSDLRPDINYVWNLLSCLCGTPSLTRGRVCLVSITVSSNCPASSSFFFVFLFPHFTCHAFYVYTMHARPSQPWLSTADHAP